MNADGSAPYNIENLMQATWRVSDGSGNLTWQLNGGRVPDDNHAKWGLTTPHSGHVNTSNVAPVPPGGVTHVRAQHLGHQCPRWSSSSWAFDEHQHIQFIACYSIVSEFLKLLILPPVAQTREPSVSLPLHPAV
ncbi:dead deah box rna [Phytophthora cinnamomi]|uniref:dead deah box rna n=1 Tax=Phytophthora cinnamomi TaxID=4785 RepID=UPI0035596BF4|nr:dead deah box rna [Phytophthora cinnamomi]